MKTSVSCFYIITLLLVILTGCSPKHYSTRYYTENEKILEKIEQSYKELYNISPFNISFSDKQFNIVSMEFVTDSILYIYEFNIDEPRLKDSLVKYNVNPEKALTLINRMHAIRCTWINNFNYYENDTKRSLIFMSIKPVGLSGFLSSKKYYTICFFPTVQHYDSKGRLLSGRRSRILRKLNGDIFRRINDKVSYTISSQFR